MEDKLVDAVTQSVAVERFGSSRNMNSYPVTQIRHVVEILVGRIRAFGYDDEAIHAMLVPVPVSRTVPVSQTVVAVPRNAFGD